MGRVAVASTQNGSEGIASRKFSKFIIEVCAIVHFKKVTKFLHCCLQQRIRANYSFCTNVSNLVCETVAATVAATVAESVAAKVSAKHQHVRYTALSSPQPAGRRFPRIFTAQCFFVKHMGANFNQN